VRTGATAVDSQPKTAVKLGACNPLVLLNESTITCDWLFLLTETASRIQASPRPRISAGRRK